jgi:hypothetical protein
LLTLSLRSCLCFPRLGRLRFRARAFWWVVEFELGAFKADDSLPVPGLGVHVPVKARLV